MSTKLAAAGLQGLVLAASVALGTPAFAQSAPEPPLEQEGLEQRDETLEERPAPSMNLTIHGIGDGLHVRVLSREEGAAAVDNKAVADCTQDCELKLPAGPYRLITSQGAEQTMKDVDLDAPLRLTVNEPKASLHGLGVGLGIAGIVVASLGTLVAAVALTIPSDGQDPSETRKTAVYSGLLGIGAGAGLIVGGFSLAADTHAPSLELDRGPSLQRLQRPSAAGVSVSGVF